MNTLPIKGFTDKDQVLKVDLDLIWGVRVESGVPGLACVCVCVTSLVQMEHVVTMSGSDEHVARSSAFEWKG